MASQPANATISVFVNVRTYRQNLRQESVKNITNHLRELVFSVPGQEVYTTYGVRLTPTDFSPFMGEARHTPVNDGFYSPSAVRGLPVTVGATTAKDYNHVTILTNTAIPFTIGADNFVEKDTRANAAAGDLHKELRDA